LGVGFFIDHCDSITFFKSEPDQTYYNVVLSRKAYHTPKACNYKINLEKIN